MIFLKIFSGPSSWDSSSFILIILRFGICRRSQISWMFRVMNFLDLTFSLTNVSFFPSYLQCLILSLQSLVFFGDACVCGSGSHTYIFHSQNYLSLCFHYCFYVHFQITSIFIHFVFSWLSLTDFVISSNYFPNFLKEYIHFLLKDLNQLYKVGFKLFFFFYCASVVLEYSGFVLV